MVMKTRYLFIWLIVSLTIFSSVCYGQDGGVLRFLGIPVAGSEEQFAEQLVAKGFTQSDHPGVYSGQFDGKPVEVAVRTKNDVVDQVSVSFRDTTEKGIISEYNHMLDQLRSDKSLMNFNMDEALLDNAPVSARIANGKSYEAHFSYYDPDRNPPLMDALLDKLSDYFTDKQKEKLKDLMQKAAAAPEGQKAVYQYQLLEEMKKMGLGEDPDGKPDAGKMFKFMGDFMMGLKSLSDGDIWFKIHEIEKNRTKQYQIVLYYDTIQN